MQFCWEQRGGGTTQAAPPKHSGGEGWRVPGGGGGGRCRGGGGSGATAPRNLARVPTLGRMAHFQQPQKLPPQAPAPRLRVPGARLPVSWGPASSSGPGGARGQRPACSHPSMAPHASGDGTRGPSAPGAPGVRAGKPGRLGPPPSKRHPWRSGGQGGPSLLGPEASPSPWGPGRQALVSPLLSASRGSWQQNTPCLCA